MEPEDVSVVRRLHPPEPVQVRSVARRRLILELVVVREFGCTLPDPDAWTSAQERESQPGGPPLELRRVCVDDDLMFRGAGERVPRHAEGHLRGC